jgi:hypothetical protein
MQELAGAATRCLIENHILSSTSFFGEDDINSH